MGRALILMSGPSPGLRTCGEDPTQSSKGLANSDDTGTLPHRQQDGTSRFIVTGFIALLKTPPQQICIIQGIVSGLSLSQYNIQNVQDTFPKHSAYKEEPGQYEKSSKRK